MEYDKPVSSVTRIPEVGTITVSQDNLVTFVAEDFLEQIRQSGNSTANNDRQKSVSISSDVPIVDAEILDNLERYTEQLSSSLENLMAKLTNDLHKASAITVGYAQTYNDAAESMGTAADEAVRSKYSLIAHSEELSRSMEPVHKVYQKIKHVKAILAALEAQVI